MFYLTPYITCQKCNSIMFIDAAKARADAEKAALVIQKRMRGLLGRRVVQKKRAT
mgnify:CR=1 FL=1